MAEIQSHDFKIKDGRVVTLRSATDADAQNVWDYARSIFKEDVFSLTTLEEFQVSVEEEKQWIESNLKNPNAIVLLALSGEQIIGLLDFSQGHRNRIAHTGQFGMSVAKVFRGQGIGGALLSGLISWARETRDIEKINLNVHSNNGPAQALYRKMGFVVEGVRKKGLKYGPGEYLDTIEMSLLL